MNVRTRPFLGFLTDPVKLSGMFPEPDFIDSNGIRMAVYEQGEGPAVILLHGFPELAFSWRHQFPALAAAGFRAIAPDLRGYGQTSVPAEVADYRIDKLIGDVEGLLDAFNLPNAIFIGHDWGALLLWHMAILAPERIEKLIILNIPHYPRPAEDPVSIWRRRFGDDYYIVDFQDSDRADCIFARDPVRFFDVTMRRNQISRASFDKLPTERKVISLINALSKDRHGGERLLTSDERDYYASAYAASGFTGPINWYRNWTHNWRRMEGVDPTIRIPTLFIGAHDDVLIAPEHIEGMAAMVPDLDVHVLNNCGHWSQQEKPDEINHLIVDWLVQRR
ncbi:MAG: alpha/beta fold hydrolase [Woeseiaceae bacterium]